VEITAALAADLTALTEALDDPDTDIAATLRELATGAKLAVRSYLGLSVTITARGQQIIFTALEDHTQPDDIGTSLMIPLPPTGPDGNNAEPINALILYAQRHGAFIDLAADLSWLSDRDPSEFVLDHHLTLPNHLDAPEGLTVASVINQAIGVLIAYGRTPEQAHRELDARAARGGVDPRTVASRILTNPAVIAEEHVRAWHPSN
jgi:ANTAR domain